MMPLHSRRWEDHYSANGKAPHDEHVVLLTGSLAIGTIYRLRTKGAGGRYRWVIGLGLERRFIDGGTASSMDEGMALVKAAFVGMIARAGLAETTGARPGPPYRHAPLPVVSPSVAPTHDPGLDGLGIQTGCGAKRIAIRSGELVCGILDRNTRGREAGFWSWFLTGLNGPPSDEFISHGLAYSEAEAFDAFSICWAAWIEWAGLQQIVELRCNS